ncbi:unnamed protein product [Hymenolepis diminuta]|uniref:Uncharacterized protein n=1 Tax=Hymenolepis diminuta TaxID=6216 RepID=A0A564YLP6_HYMDI|nr:unnamed protein product [Hymenolepis diminuta]
MTHNPCPSDMSKRVHRFPLFNNRLASHKRHICTHALAWPYPNNTHWSVRIPTRPVHLLSSSARCSPSFSPSLRYLLGFLDYMFGLFNSWCSASQLLLGLTQTATNWLP